MVLNAKILFFLFLPMKKCGEYLTLPAKTGRYGLIHGNSIYFCFWGWALKWLRELAEMAKLNLVCTLNVITINSQIKAGATCFETQTFLKYNLCLFPDKGQLFFKALLFLVSASLTWIKMESPLPATVLKWSFVIGGRPESAQWFWVPADTGLSCQSWHLIF